MLGGAGARAYTLLICRERRAVSLSARGIHVFFALFLAEAAPPRRYPLLGYGMFDELVEVLGKFPSVVVERRHVSVARHIFNAAGEKGGEGLEPVVLGDGALSADHARHLVQQAIHGAPFAVDDLGRVEVLFDQRRSYAQAMLAPDRVEESNDALLLGNGTPLCVRIGRASCRET